MNLRLRNQKREKFVRFHRGKLKKIIQFIDDTRVNFAELREARKLVEKARLKLDYSPWTSNYDIFSGLIRIYEKKFTNTAHG